MRVEAPAGPKIVVARSAEGNSELSVRIRSLGMIPVPVDTVEFSEPSDWSKVDRALTDIGKFDWIALTSPRGASLFARRMKKVGIRPAERLPRMAAVGEATADRVREEGFAVGFVPSEFTTVELGRQLPTKFGRRVLLLRAEKAGQEVVNTLERRGFSVTSVPIYRTRFMGRRYRGTRIADAKAVLLGSPSEVEGLARRLTPAALGRLKSKAVAICIGPVTARSAREEGFKHVAASKVHTFDALLMEASRLVVR